VLIYHLKGTAAYRDIVADIFRRAVQGQTEIVLSTIVQLELLAQPMAQGDFSGIEDVLKLTEEHPNVLLRDVDRPVVFSAAWIKGKARLGTGDALVVASAVIEGCDMIIGNDRRWKSLDALQGAQVSARGRDIFTVPPYLHLDDYVST
jgi:predicted nucleic acid-binding protein